MYKRSLYKKKNEFIIAFLIGSLLQAWSILELSIRDATDIDYAEKDCGTVEKYQFLQQAKRINARRLYIKNHNGISNFNVNSPYVKEHISKSDFIKGTEICIYYLTKYSALKRPFITQIKVGEHKELLPEKIVISTYLRKPYVDEWGFLSFLMLVTVFLMLNKNKRD